MRYLIIFLLAVNILYSQSYLIRELKGGIWVTSQVEITNNNQTNQGKQPSLPKTPIKSNSYYNF